MILTPLDKSQPKRDIRFATMDLEAWKWINFIVAGFYDGVTNTYKYFATLEEYVDFSFNFCKKHKIKNIFAHFGGKYDFNFLLKELTFSDKYSVHNIIPRGASILSFDVRQRGLKKSFELTYRDSSALLPFGLASLGDAFGVSVQKDHMDFEHIKEAWENEDYSQKLRLKLMDDPNDCEASIERYEIEYDENGKVKRYFDKEQNVWHERIYDRAILLEYLRKDCISLYQVIAKFYEWPLVKDSGPSTTTASQAVKIWRLYLDTEIHSITNEKIDEFIRDNCYYGGRTEIFRPLFDAKYNIKKNEHKFSKEALAILKKQKNKKLYYLDVNSLYPSVMQQNDFPIRYSRTVSGKSAYEKMKNQFGFWDVEVEVPEMKIPPLPINHTFKNGSKKLIFPIGKFRGKWSTYELEYAKTLGVKITKYHTGHIFDNGGKIFKKFIDELYAIRLEAKRNNDGVGNMNAKLIMNSCYGRLGLLTDRTNLVVDDGSIGLKFHSEIEMNGRTVRFMEKPVSLDKSFTNVAIPAMVTSYARVLMHKLMLEVGEDHVYYTDTDSIFIDKPWQSGDELGQLKLEYTCESACFLLPKTYVNDGIEGEKVVKKITMKGFPKKKIQGFTLSDFIHALRGDLERLKIRQEAKFATLKQASRNGTFLMMVNDPVTKRTIDEKKEQAYFELTGKRKKFVKESYEESFRNIRSQYDKRIITNQGLTSKPIYLDNNKET